MEMVIKGLKIIGIIKEKYEFFEGKNELGIVGMYEVLMEGGIKDEWSDLKKIWEE